MAFPEIEIQGTTVKLLWVSPCCVYLGGQRRQTGRFVDGEPVEVEVADMVGDAIIGADGRLYPLCAPSNESYCIIVAPVWRGKTDDE